MRDSLFFLCFQSITRILSMWTKEVGYRNGRPSFDFFSTLSCWVLVFFWSIRNRNLQPSVEKVCLCVCTYIYVCVSLHTCIYAHAEDIRSIGFSQGRGQLTEGMIGVWADFGGVQWGQGTGCLLGPLENGWPHLPTLPPRTAGGEISSPLKDLTIWVQVVLKIHSVPKWCGVLGWGHPDSPGQWKFSLPWKNPPSPQTLLHRTLAMSRPPLCCLETSGESQCLSLAAEDWSHLPLPPMKKKIYSK